MSKYTIELRLLLESGYDIGLKDYPIFDESYRATLNKMITDHYYMDEIGQETPGLFKHYLNQTMREIMPTYNRLYLAQLALVNPLYGVDLTETYTKTTEGTSSNETATASAAETLAAAADNLLAVESDTPQNLLSVADIRNNLYASKANRQDNTRSDSSNSNGSSTATTQFSGLSTDEYTKRVTGNNGRVSNAQLLEDFTRSLINLNQMVIRDLRSCFMEVY